jgi:hypothetical protein
MPEIIQIIMLAASNAPFVILAQFLLFRDAELDVVWLQLSPCWRLDGFSSSFRCAASDGSLDKSPKNIDRTPGSHRPEPRRGFDPFLT